MNTPLAVGVAVVVCAFAALVVWLVQESRQRKLSADWPRAEGTIQYVGQVVVNAKQYSYTIDVGDFSYKVNDEFYSGRLKISRPFNSGDGSPRTLVDQKISVSYDPRKPEKFFVPLQEVQGFNLNPYRESSFATDVDSIDLNLNKM